MNKSSLLIVIVAIVSCNQHDKKDKYLSELPDSTMITAVITIITKIDSLKRDYSISSKLIIPVIYYIPESTNDSIPLPPPPPDSYVNGK